MVLQCSSTQWLGIRSLQEHVNVWWLLFYLSFKIWKLFDIAKELFWGIVETEIEAYYLKIHLLF